jgi:MFS family permease
VPRPNRIIALMLGLSAMSYFDRTVLSIAAPSIMREFGISETAMGTLFSAFLVSYTILMTPGGALADRFGPRRVLGVATLGAAVTTGILAVPDPAAALIGIVPTFFCARLLFGAFTAPIYPSCARMVSNWVPPEQHARVQALILSGAGAGGALTPYTFSRLVSWLGWRAGFGVAGLATAILAVVWYWTARDRPAGGTARERKGAPVRVPLRRLLTDRNLALLTVSYFCLNYFEYIFFYWMYYYFGEIRHMSPSESAIYTTVMFVTMALGIVGGGWISDWLARPLGLSRARRLLAVGAMVLSAVLLYLGATSTAVIPTVTFLSLALGVACIAEGPFWAAAMGAGEGKEGSAGGILNCGGNLGGMLAPVLTPIVAARLGWTWGLYVGSAMVLLGVTAWVFIADRDRDRAIRAGIDS